MHVCPRCNEQNPARARFCLACGTALVHDAAAPAEERKVVTVLFADVVGFTTIAEQLDPEDVRSLLRPFYALLRATLTRYGGTIEQFTGDGVMALFGAPVAHGDDPERAVRAALAIREAVADRNERETGRDLQVRIGINTGTVIVAHDRAGREGERIVAGDAVNVAQRLQTVAPPNGIFVGEITQRATASVLEYRGPQTTTVKGRAEPVQVWEALQPRARFGADFVREASAQLVGRHAEIALLVGLLERVRSRREPQFVTIVGDPGLGKSRLLLELFNHARRTPELMFWRQGRCLPYGEQSSFWALGEIVKAQAGILESDSADVVDARLRADLERRHEGEDFEWVESHLRTLVGLGDGAAAQQSASFAAWRRWVEALAGNQPLILVVEDLHWADDGLLDFVDMLAERARGVALLVVCTARPELLERRPSWGGGKRNATTITLEPLSDDETGELVDALLPGGLLPGDVRNAVVAHAGGNPFFAEEYVRMFHDRHFLSLADGVWRLEWDEDGLPVTVQGIIAARIDALGADEKALLLDASVIGKVFWIGALARLSGVAPERLHELLTALEERELIRRERRSSLAGEEEFGFRHALVRDVAYALIPRVRRGAKHAQAAGWIEDLAVGREDHAEARAHHYEEALAYAEGRDTVRGARARRAFAEAGDRAARLNAHVRAVRHYERAIALTPDDSLELPRLLLKHATELFRADGGGEQELVRARESLLAVGDDEGAAEACVHLALFHFSVGRRDDAFAALERGAGLVAALPASPTKVRVLSRYSSQLLIGDRGPEAVEVGERALAIAQELGDDELLAQALRTVGNARAALGDARGREEMERGIALALRLNAFDAVPAITNLAAMYTGEGDLRRAWELEAQARALCDRFGDAFISLWLTMKRAAELYYRGRWDEALAVVDEVLTSDKWYAAMLARLTRAPILLARDRVRDALVDTGIALDAGRETRDSQLYYPALTSRARALTFAGREDEAAEVAQELLDNLRGDEMFMGMYWLDLTLVLLRLGRADELLPHAEQVAHPTRWVDAAVQIAGGDFVAAAETCREIGAMPEEAAARMYAARQLREAGDGEAADPQLALATSFFERVGATAMLRRVAELNPALTG